MKNLVLAEIEKLVRSSVFMVAPIVLFFFLGLMLFGFEVYAAKNGVESELVKSGNIEYSDNTQMTGSAVVSTFIVFKNIGINVFNLATFGLFKKSVDGQRENKEEELIILKPGDVGEFGYLRTFLKSLFNPKPLPRPDCDCENCSEKKEGALNIDGLFKLFTAGTAYAAEKMPAKEPPLIIKEDSFIERVQKRVVWLVDSVNLENMLIDRSRFNGLRFTYLSLYFSFVFVFPLLTVSVVAQMFAGEFSHGTIRTCLLNPISRTKFLCSKIIVVFIYLIALMAFFVFTTMLVGVTFAGYGNLILDSQLIGDIGESRMILGDGAVLLFLLTIPVAAISFFPLASFGILISYIKPEPSTVIGLVTIIYFILFTLGGLPLFEDIRFLFFTTYMDAWTLMFVSPFPAGVFVYKISILILITAGLLIIVNHLSSNRDIYE